MSEILKLAAEGGVAISALAALIFYVRYSMIRQEKAENKYTEERTSISKAHSSEREDWRQTSQMQFDKMVEVATNNTTVMAELRGILTRERRDS